jgi:hypothetical protein
VALAVVCTNQAFGKQGQAAAAVPRVVLPTRNAGIGTGTGLPRTTLPRPLYVNPFVARTVHTGTFVYNITITIKSTLPTSDTIDCTGSAFTQDISSASSIQELASVAASRSGSTASCKVTIPYAWPLASASSDTVILEYQITVPAGLASLPNRESNIEFATLSGVPASGTTTSETIAATI